MILRWRGEARKHGGAHPGFRQSECGGQVVDFVEPGHAQLRLCQRVIENDTISTFATDADEPMVLEFAPFDLTLARQWMIAPAHQHEWVLQEQTHGEIRVSGTQDVDAKFNFSTGDALKTFV